MLLPPIFARFQVDYVQRVTEQEYSSSCPVCGGTVHENREWPDRCRWFLDSPERGWCRKCGQMFWPDEDTVPDPVAVEKWRAKQERREEERKAAAERALEHLRSGRVWQEYNKQLDKASRRLWEQRGVSPGLQDTWGLGYDPNHEFWKKDGRFVRPTLTIPIFNEGYDLLNVKHRLLEPPEGYGKYRYEFSIPNYNPGYLWRALPEESLTEEVVAVEGEIKAMVVAARAGMELGVPVGLPGTNPGKPVLEQLKNAGHIYLIVDPDARKAAWDICKAIGPEKFHVLVPTARMGKIDDWILSAQPSTQELRWIIRQYAKPAWN